MVQLSADAFARTREAVLAYEKFMGGGQVPGGQHAIAHQWCIVKFIEAASDEVPADAVRIWYDRPSETWLEFDEDTKFEVIPWGWDGKAVAEDTHCFCILIGGAWFGLIPITCPG